MHRFIKGNTHNKFDYVIMLQRFCIKSVSVYHSAFAGFTWITIVSGFISHKWTYLSFHIYKCCKWFVSQSNCSTFWNLNKCQSMIMHQRVKPMMRKTYERKNRPNRRMYTWSPNTYYSPSVAFNVSNIAEINQLNGMCVLKTYSILKPKISPLVNLSVVYTYSNRFWFISSHP